MEMTENTAFKLILAQDSHHYLALEYDGLRLNLLYGLKGREQIPPLYEQINTVSDLELFLDKSAVEIFVNKGKYVGTKTYFFEPDDLPLEYHFNTRKAVRLMEVIKIKNIWDTYLKEENK